MHFLIFSNISTFQIYTLIRFIKLFMFPHNDVDFLEKVYVYPQ